MARRGMSKGAKVAAVVGMGSIVAMIATRRSAQAATPDYSGGDGSQPLPDGSQPFQTTPGAAGAPGAPAPLPALAARGDPNVQQYQQELQQLGYQPGPLDGRMGPQTARAIRDFQRSFGLAQTGVLDQGTQSAIDDAVSSVGSQVQSGAGGYTPGASSTPGSFDYNVYNPSQSLPTATSDLVFYGPRRANGSARGAHGGRRY